MTGDPSGFNRDLVYGHSVFGELHSRYKIQVLQPPKDQTVNDRVRSVRDLMAERELGNDKRGRFAYPAGLEEFARDIEKAKWPTDRDGRVTRETDLDHNEAEHTADALYYGVSYYFARGTYSWLPRTGPPSIGRSRLELETCSGEDGEMSEALSRDCPRVGSSRHPWPSGTSFSPQPPADVG